MEEADAPRVAAIEETIFSQPWSTQGFVDALGVTGTIFLVAEEANAIVGYIGMYVSFEEGEITNVAVDKEYRHKGIGQLLVEEICKQGAQSGVTRIVLEVRSSNQPAISLYENNHFIKIGVRKNFYDFPKEDADIMVWEK